MTLTLIHPLGNVRIRPGSPIIGLDLSTVRLSACVLTSEGARWHSKTLERVEHLALRTTMGADAMADHLEWLQAEYGLPELVGLEVPLAGGHTPLPSFWMVGAFYVAAGDVYGARVPVRELGPGEWKKAATGRGIAPNLPKAPKGATKTERGRVATERRRIEKARIMTWARDTMGYPASASLEDEADATGVAVAAAMGWDRGRRR